MTAPNNPTPRRFRPAYLITLAAIPIFSCGEKAECALSDSDCDGVPDNLGRAYDHDGKHGPDPWDFDGNGTIDGYAVDRNDDGQPDALGLDLDGDGLVDAVDWNLDGIPDEFTPHGTYGTGEPPIQGDGDASLPVVPAGNCLSDGGAHVSSYDTYQRYQNIDVSRGGTNYRLITNGWGDNWVSHHIAGVGTQMRVVDFQGTVGGASEPAGYPTVYLGDYSNTGPSIGSPLPRPISSLSALHTGLRWSHPAGGGAYNVAWDVWLSNQGQHSGYFMVWLRDPPGYKPAGQLYEEGIVVSGVNGAWNIIEGWVNVNGVDRPIINYVRAEGNDSYELGFNLLDFFADAQMRGYSIPGTEVMGVAIGFEIWQGPIQDLAINDFCVTVL